MFLLSSGQALAADVCSSSQTCARVPILMYHHVRDYRNPRDRLGMRLSIPVSVFGRQLDALKAAGYHTVSFADLQSAKLPAKPVILTFDDGYDNAATNVLPMLKSRGFVGTFYIISGKVGTPGYATDTQLKDLLSAGMELGAHTVNHRELSRLSEAKQSVEINDSVGYLRKTFGIQVVTFAFPSGKYNKTTLKLLATAGMPYAVTTHHGVAVIGRSSPLQLPRVRMSENTSMNILLKSLGRGK